MSKPLTTAISNQINTKSVKPVFKLYINSVEFTNYLQSWTTSFDTQFGSASANFILLNDQAVFSEGGIYQVNIGDTVELVESYAGDTTSFKKFYGIVNQRSIVKSKPERTITLNCLDYIAVLKNWDIDVILEGTKVQITDETLTPQFLTSPNEAFAQIFNFANAGLAQNPLPIIKIKDNTHMNEDIQNSGFDVLYDVGQLKLGSPLSALTNYSIIAQSYSFYTKGLYIEDVLQTLLTTVNGYGRYLFDETSAQAVIDNHLKTTYQDEEGESQFDVLTPNTSEDTITIEATLTQACIATDTVVYLSSIDGLPAAGTGTINGDTIVWTGINATNKTLTGVTSLLAHPISSYFKYTKTYPIGQVWYLKYSNLYSTLVQANFTLPAGASVIYFDARYGRIILQNAGAITDFVRCNYNYEFCTLQATGIEINYIAFRSREVQNRFDAVSKLFSYLAPNYIVRTKGDNKIWSSYMSQRTVADYTLTLASKLNYMEDTDLYTRVKFFGTNKNPTNIMFDPSVSFLTTGRTYKATATGTQLSYIGTDASGKMVYKTNLGQLGYIVMDSFVPILYINNVPIDNQTHQMIGLPVTIKETTTSTTTSSGGGKF